MPEDPQKPLDTKNKGEHKDAIKQDKPAAAGLKSTLNLPRTTFPMKANLPVNEPLRLAQWEAQGLYSQIRAARAGAPKYILHDGPPYANGAIHLGHALNKCIKDFVVKTKTMAGFDAPYVPGWDCHGLPIEIKVDEQLGRKKLEMDPIAVRQACRDYAQKYVDLQSSQFQRIGVFGRWNNPYLTMSFEYEARVLECFYAFFEKGFVYKGLKPVFWCIHDRTALAEAEVEYEQHTSPSVYIRYKLTSDPGLLDPALRGQDVSTIIWTTTPWTIPASQAVAFNPQLEYVAVHCDTGTYIVAQALLSSVIVHCHLMSGKHPAEPASQADIVALFPGDVLDRTTFQHPFLDRSILGVLAGYVTADQGTGAVHTAPAHGVDDFATGKRYDLPELQYVDNAGRQRNTAEPGGGAMPYEDLTIFKSNPVITELLREHGALLSATTFEHSYPHCWRCHNPVIVRATEQWFIDMETPMPDTKNTMKGTGFSPSANASLNTAASAAEGSVSTFRQRALDEIDKVTWDPSWGKERISNMIATRPDWCISRQRIWGVPIAVFLCEQCHTPLNNPAINRSIVDLFQKESADAWYKYDAARLLPKGTACAACGGAEFRKEMDILDVWFESGSSWHAVLEADPELRFPADLYTEGGDQHRGWFHSSLLTSVAMRDEAPYTMVATSGWTLDENGRAFSKSLGNGVDPVDIAKRLGAEIIRLWVASVDFREDVAASENLMQRVSDNYRKLRNTLRFLLSNLYDFDPATHAVPYEAMQWPDKYILTRMSELDEKIRAAYDAFEFHRAYHALNAFVNTDLSALYLDLSKDILYTFPHNHPDRRSAQTALWRIAEALTRLIAPILSFTADEVWQLLPKLEGRAPSVHLALFPEASEIAPIDTETLLSDFEQLLDVRKDVLDLLELKRKEGTIGKSLEARVVFSFVQASPDKQVTRLEAYRPILPQLFGTSQVRFEYVTAHADLNSNLMTWVEPAHGTKCDRCWRYTEDVGQDHRFPTVCLRCAEALDAIDFAPYTAESPAQGAQSGVLTA